jgi:hypothetical protein
MIRSLLLFSALFLTSCGSSYHSAFQKAKQAPHSVEGPWKGSWKSEINGHHGPLWCIVSQNKKEPALWNFRYRAGWGVLQFGDYLHQVPTKLEPNGSLPLEAKMKLPKNFGTYSVKGQLTPEEFKVRYYGQGDKGTMILSRPK